MENVVNWDNVQLQTIDVMENLQATMPDHLQKMNESDSQEWYLNEKKPQIIYANEDRSLFCTYSIYDQILDDEAVFVAATKVKQLIQKSVPSKILTDVQLITADNKKQGWFETLLLSGGSRQVFLMYVMPVLGKFMLGTFVYPRGDHLTKRICVRIMMSLQAVGFEVKT